jgi:hypothetical protein
LAAFGQQHRPVCRAFRLLCTSLTCLLLLISTLSAPATASAPSKVLRYGTQKAANTSSALADMECRKRPVAGKATPLDGGGIDLGCLSANTGVYVNGTAVNAAIVPPFAAGSDRIQTRGARAPPCSFA